MEMDNAYVGTSYLMNEAGTDVAFARSKFTTFRAKYTNFGYIEDMSADP